MFNFVMVQILVYLRHQNGGGKLKFNEFTGSVEYSGRTTAGLSYEFCVCFFKKKGVFIFKIFKPSFGY